MAALVPVIALLACGDDDVRDSFAAPTADAGLEDARSSSPTADASPDGALEAATDAAVALPKPIEVTCAVSPCVVSLAARGGSHVCALLADGHVSCWGSNDSGQLGSPSDGGGHPMSVAGISGATQLSATGADATGTSCARLQDGTVMCWGSNVHGQLGQAPDGDLMTDGDAHPTPSVVQGLDGASRVDLGGSFACATSAGAAGQLTCWGWNSVLQLGRGYLPKSHGAAGAVPLGARAVIGATGNARDAFAITTYGELLSWGGSSWDPQSGSVDRDALGRESSLTPDGTPTPIPTLGNVTSVSAGEQHVCAIVDQGAHCWGRNATGAVGNGTRQDVRSPYAVTTEAGEHLRAVAVSNRTSCVVTFDGAAYCWGDNADSQLGGGHAEATLLPVHVERSSGRIVQIVAMDRATCVLVEDGSVECWGSNTHGQLGVGTRDDDAHVSPQKVIF